MLLVLGSNKGLTAGARPLRASLTELETLLSDSADSFRCQGALPNSFRDILRLPNSSLNHVPDLLMFGELSNFWVPSTVSWAGSMLTLETEGFWVDVSRKVEEPKEVGDTSLLRFLFLSEAGRLLGLMQRIETGSESSEDSGLGVWITVLGVVGLGSEPASCSLVVIGAIELFLDGET